MFSNLLDCVYRYRYRSEVFLRRYTIQHSEEQSVRLPASVKYDGARDQRNGNWATLLPAARNGDG